MKKRHEEISRDVRVFQGTGKVWIAIASLSVVVNLLMLTGPLFMLQVYDRVLASGSIPTLVVLGGGVLFLYVFYGVLESLRGRIAQRTVRLLDERITEEVFRLTSVVRFSGGAQRLQINPVQDWDACRQFLCGPGPLALFDIPWLPFYLILVWCLHPVLGVVGLGGAIVIICLIGLNEWGSRRVSGNGSRSSIERQRMVDEFGRNSEAVRSMGMTGALENKWTKVNFEFVEGQARGADWSLFYSSLTKTFRFILQSLILATGAFLVIRQEASGGIMIAASIMISKALAPVEVAVGQWRPFLAARQSFGRLRSLFSKGAERSVKMDLPLPACCVDIEGFSCAPIGASNPLVKGVSFSLESGHGIGIIGPSGSGKSTFVRGLVNVVPALTGSVRFDGSEITQWAPEKHGKIVGYLPQDVQIFSGTVAENIARFDPDWKSDLVHEAAKLTGLHEMIAGLPDGYDTVIGPGGYSLSGGQLQRIGLARALYDDPFFVVLDEPNSNLDADGEAALTSSLLEMRRRGSIVVVVAHRASALAGVDMVLCLKEGRVVSLGPKEQVLSKMISDAKEKDAA